MKISIRDLRTAVDFLEGDAGRVCAPNERDALGNVAGYLRYVADQREEFEARQQPEHPRFTRVRAALARLQSGRNARLAGGA